MRVFYAAFLGAESADYYSRLVRSLEELLPGVVRAVPPASHHLTMAFLGEVPDEDLVHCVQSLARVSEAAEVPITLEPARVLYGRGAPRLILADVAAGAEALRAIQAGLRARLVERFPDKELRPRRTHATLARFRKGLPRDAGRRVEKALRGLSSQGRRDVIDRICLVKSALTNTGPVYETLDERRLGTGGEPQ